MSLWMLEDFFWLMVVGQVMLIGLFTWVDGGRALRPALGHPDPVSTWSTTCSHWRWQAPVEIEPLVTHTNDLLLGSMPPWRRSCFIGHAPIAHAVVRPEAGVRI